MKKNQKVAGVLAALTMLAGAPAANASVLLSNEGTSFDSMADMFDTSIQPLARISVASNVADFSIGGFGVFGQSQDNTTLRWVIFDGNNVRYEFTQTVAATTGWLNSPLLNFQLQHGHTYALGVVSTGGFAWSRDFDDSFSGTLGSVPGANGLSLNPVEASATVTWDSPTNFTGVVRAADLDTDAQGYPGVFRSSLQVFSAGTSGPLPPVGGPAPPVPEPAEWSMLLAGLLVVAFVANRQRRQPV